MTNRALSLSFRIGIPVPTFTLMLIMAEKRVKTFIPLKVADPALWIIKLDILGTEGIVTSHKDGVTLLERKSLFRSCVSPKSTRKLEVLY